MLAADATWPRAEVERADLAAAWMEAGQRYATIDEKGRAGGVGLRGE